MAAVIEVSQLFSDLERCGIDGNYIKGLKISNKSNSYSFPFLKCSVDLQFYALGQSIIFSDYVRSSIFYCLFFSII